MEDILLLRFYLLGLAIVMAFFVVALTRRHDRELFTRTIVFFVLVNLFCGVLWAGSLAFSVLMGVILGLAVFELNSHYRLLPAAIAAIILAITVFVSIIQSPRLLVGMVPIFGVLSILTFLGKPPLIRHPAYLVCFCAGWLATSTASLAVFYDNFPEMIFLPLLLSQFNDVAGYWGGKKFGRYKPFTLSPNKTLEGYGFSALGIVAGIIVLYTLVPNLRGHSPAQAAILLVYVFVVGNAGDLLMSSLKRKLGIKDFSRMLAGHGGLLDRFDNVLTIAPLMYALVVYGII